MTIVTTKRLIIILIIPKTGFYYISMFIFQIAYNWLHDGIYKMKLFAAT